MAKESTWKMWKIIIWSFQGDLIQKSFLGLAAVLVGKWRVHRRFEKSVCPRPVLFPDDEDTVLETSVYSPFNHLTRLLARVNFIKPGGSWEDNTEIVTKYIG